MAGQLSLLPLMHQFSKEGYIRDTTYFENEDCKESNFHLVFNKKIYSLLVPKDKNDWLFEIGLAETVVITKGSYNGKPYFEMMFLDNIEKPVIKMIPDEDFERVTPLKEGWYGRFCIYDSFLNNLCNAFERVYYRVADILPFGKPVGK
jgi:hypothetical protein